MLTLKLLQDYGEYKIGDLVDIQDEADAQTLITDGIGEKHIAIELAKDDIEWEKRETSLINKIKESIKSELKIPAQPRDEDKKIFKSLGDFAQEVIVGKSSPRLNDYIKSSGLNEAIGADGGFLIPQEYSTALLTAIAQAGVLAPKCQNFASNHNLSLPFVNRSTQATSWTGGVTIYKPAEGVAKTTSVPQFGKCELKLNKLTAVVYATDELLNDAPLALQTFLTTMVSTEMALTKDEDIINGSGAGEALGVVNAPATVTVDKVTAQAAATIEYDNVAEMWSRLYNPSRSKAVWLINQDCMTEISKLSIAVGTGGSGVMVMNAATNMPQSLFGAPIIWSPHCQTLGTSGDIILGDFSQYVTLTKAGMGMETATSIHLKFLEDETAFRFVVRFDGQPWWSSAVTPKHGSNTVSPFIKLAVRE